jgi:cephalosporin hydroxylase
MAAEPQKSVSTWRSLRDCLGGAVLVVLLAVIAYKLGWLDSLMVKRLQFLAQEQGDGQWANTMFGVVMLQYPEDLQSYQEIISEEKPDYIVECGTWAGGLTLYLSSVLDNVNPNAKIFTIDIDGERWRKTVQELKDQPAGRLLSKIEFIESSSTAPEVFARVNKEVQGKKVLVILDSAHTKEHVLNELKLYSPLVPKGGYLLVNDTHLDGTRFVDYKDGPAAAVKEFLQTAKDFSVDTARDRFFITCMPGGFLKRSN